MSSKVEVINTGLVGLRVAPISLPIEDTEAGRKVNAVYDIFLRSLLRSHPWSFAKKETALSRLSDVPVLDDYLYIFSLPPDFVKLLKTSVQPSYTHKIKGKRLYSNSNAISIEYIWFNEDPNSWDDTFVEAFAAKIAAELSYAFTADRKLIETKWAEFKAKLNIARTANAHEVTPDEPQSDEWINARI